MILPLVPTRRSGRGRKAAAAATGTRSGGAGHRPVRRRSSDLPSTTTPKSTPWSPPAFCATRARSTTTPASPTPCPTASGGRLPGRVDHRRPRRADPRPDRYTGAAVGRRRSAAPQRSGARENGDVAGSTCGLTDALVHPFTWRSAPAATVVHALVDHVRGASENNGDDALVADGLDPLLRLSGRASASGSCSRRAAICTTSCRPASSARLRRRNRSPHAACHEVTPSTGGLAVLKAAPRKPAWRSLALDRREGRGGRRVQRSTPVPRRTGFR